MTDGLGKGCRLQRSMQRPPQDGQQDRLRNSEQKSQAEYPQEESDMIPVSDSGCRQDTLAHSRRPPPEQQHPQDRQLHQRRAGCRMDQHLENL